MEEEKKEYTIEKARPKKDKKKIEENMKNDINIKALLRENIVYSGFWISVANVFLKGCKKICKHFIGRVK